MLLASTLRRSNKTLGLHNLQSCCEIEKTQANAMYHKWGGLIRTKVMCILGYAPLVPTINGYKSSTGHAQVAARSVLLCQCRLLECGKGQGADKVSQGDINEN